MRRLVRSVTLAFALVVLAACGSDGEESAPTTTTTTSAPATVASTTQPPATTTQPVATSAPVTITTTTTAAVTATTEPIDTEPPPAPVNVTCSTGGGSQEVQLDWDAPADPTDVVDVRLYLDEGSGFTRVEKFTVASGRVMTGPTRWSAVAYPIPAATNVQMAVTLGDAAGNESGWNPIDVYYDYSGAECVS